MSLVNVGVQLAQSGRRVLLVDFDLEAPGLPTFSLKRPEEDTPGLVEYVTQYIATGESPDVREFLYESQKFETGGGLWVMPVGKQDASYSNRLNSIDWRKLYTEQSGYLFFEDLKRQWAECISPDYVLIDSRTGHSDVEGICTRQLPNAVTLLFFPNEQNLHGLKRIVANINADNAKSTTKAIKVHFAVSNVPDLDDEDQILGKTMQKFRKELGYKELAAEIHHYNSLSLLNQEIFSLTRPNSRLTKEYGHLTKAITKHNLEDRDAVLAFLKFAHRNLPEVMNEDGPTELNDKIQKILNNFPQDYEVIFHVALVYEQLGNSNDALSMISNEAMDRNFGTAPMFATRARLSHRLGDNDSVVRNLAAMLNADGAKVETFLEVVPLIEQLGPELFELIPNSRALKSLSKDDQIFLALQFEGNEKQLKANISILQQLRSAGLEGVKIPPEFISHQIALASIGARDFNTAIELLKPRDIENSQLDKLDIANAFNLAMATWGQEGNPPINLFQYVTMKHGASMPNAGMGANYAQCMSISYAVIGDIERAKVFLNAARKEIESGSARAFSAWTYSKVSPQVFTFHLDEIERFINGEKVLPIFMTEH